MERVMFLVDNGGDNYLKMLLSVQHVSINSVQA